MTRGTRGEAIGAVTYRAVKAVESGPTGTRHRRFEEAVMTEAREGVVVGNDDAEPVRPVREG